MALGDKKDTLTQDVHGKFIMGNESEEQPLNDDDEARSIARPCSYLHARFGAYPFPNVDLTPFCPVLNKPPHSFINNIVSFVFSLVG